MSTLNIQLLCRKSKKKKKKKKKKKHPKLSPFASWLGTITNPQWLEPPMSRTIFYGPKDVRAIEVRLYAVLLIFLLILIHYFVLVSVLYNGYVFNSSPATIR